MILVTGTVELRDGAREAMVAATERMIAASRQEEGCHECRYAFDLESPNVMTFHEAWASPEAAEAHSRTPHMAEFGAAMQPLIAGPPQATMWNAEQAPTG